MNDIRVQLHKAAFGSLHERSTVLLCAAIDEIERLRTVNRYQEGFVNGYRKALLDHGIDPNTDNEGPRKPWVEWRVRS